MNPAAANRYAKSGGYDLVGKSLMGCHNEKSNEMIYKVVDWFMESSDHNKIYTFYNEKENKDVYMLQLKCLDEELASQYGNDISFLKRNNAELK